MPTRERRLHEQAHRYDLVDRIACRPEGCKLLRELELAVDLDVYTKPRCGLSWITSAIHCGRGLVMTGGLYEFLKNGRHGAEDARQWFESGVIERLYKLERDASEAADGG